MVTLVSSSPFQNPTSILHGHESLNGSFEAPRRVVGRVGW